MDGKIFADSANIWQDQAKILFNYYRQAAERIVREEERIEDEIEQLNQQKAGLEEQLRNCWWYLFLFIFPYFIRKKNLERQIAEVDARINEFQQVYTEIFRDYKVKRLGVAYVPIAEQVKYQDKSFIVDFTSTVPESEISLSMSRQNPLLIETIRTLDHLSTIAPIVETSEESETISTDDYSLSIQEVKENDYLGALERSLRTVAYCMDDLETVSVTLPLVLEDSPYLPQLDKFTTDTPESGAPVVKVFDKEIYDPGVERFRQINELKNSLSNETAQFEEILKSLMQSIGNSVQTVSRMKVASVDKVVLESNRLLFQILKSPYNHYSPVLEAEEIDRIRHEQFDYTDSIQGYEPFSLRQSSRVRFNPMSGTWVAEDGSQTVQPFGVHQMYEEIMAPMVQNLMMENRVERLKIYNHIKDQKLSYLNKWHQDTDAFYRSNRAESADLINLMQATLTEYVSAYNNLLALQRTENQMEGSDGNLDATVVGVVDNTADTLAAFEMQSQEFQKCQSEFEDYIERLKDDIDLKAARFGHVEYYDAKLRDGYSNSVAVAASEIHTMDDRRKALASVNPKLAKDSEIPPQPHVSEMADEHFSMNLTAMVREALESLNAPIDVYQPETAEESGDMPEETINDQEETYESTQSEGSENENYEENEESEEELTNDDEDLEGDEELDDEELDDEDLDDDDDDDEEDESPMPPAPPVPPLPPVNS